MRFHIGFSKRISIKKLIEIIGFLFVACLTFFGIYENAHAETLPYTNFEEYEYTDIGLNGVMTRNGNLIKNNQSSYGYSISTPAYSWGNINNYGYFLNGVTDNFEYPFATDVLKFSLKNNSYCSNNKSISFKFYVNVSDYGSTANANTLFGNYELINRFNVSINAYNKTTKKVFTTYCTKQIVNNESYNIFVSCDNAFKGDLTRKIDFYVIVFENALPLDDRIVTNSNEVGYMNTQIRLARYSSYVSPYNQTMQFYCSDDEPVYSEDSDPGGLTSIYDSIKDDYSTNLPGIDTDLTFLRLPTTFTDLLLLPFEVTQAVVNNSNQCTPYDIDLSSIIHRWGNSNQDYHLTLPCMREVLSNKLGNWYTIADMLICFFVFYEISMHVINLISAITSGEDLFSYFFRPSNSKVKYVDSSTGEVVSRG